MGQSSTRRWVLLVGGTLAVGACSEPSEPEAKHTESTLTCTLAQPIAIDVDGAPVGPLSHCTIERDSSDPESAFAIYIGDDTAPSEFRAVIGVVPGGKPGSDGRVTLDAAASIFSDASTGNIPAGSAWLSVVSSEGSYESTGEGQVSYRGASSLAAQSGDKVLWMPDGSGVVFSVVEFAAVPVRTKGGKTGTASGVVTVVSRMVTTSDPCTKPEAGGAECVEFKPCTGPSTCTCPGTTCGAQGKCCVLPGESCGEGGQCCSGYCSPTKQCEPAPPPDAAGCGPAGAPCDYSEDCPAGQYCVASACTKPGGPQDPCAALGRWYARCPAVPFTDGACEIASYSFGFDIPPTVTEHGGIFSSSIGGELDVTKCTITTYPKNVCTTVPTVLQLQKGTGTTSGFCGGQCIEGLDCVVSRQKL